MLAYFVSRKRRSEENKASHARRAYRTVPKVCDFVTNVIPRMSDSDFKYSFRLERSTFKLLCTRTMNTTVNPAGGQPQLPWETQVLIYLKYMSTQETLSSIAMLFCTTVSVVHAVIRRVLNKVNELGPEAITWPTSTFTYHTPISRQVN